MHRQLLCFLALVVGARALDCNDGTLVEMCGPYATGCTGDTCECDVPFQFPATFLTSFPGSLPTACTYFPMIIHSTGFLDGALATNIYEDWDVFFDNGPYGKEDLIVWAIQNATASVVKEEDVQLFLNDPRLTCGENASHLDIVLYRGNAQLVFGAPGVPRRNDFVNDPFFYHSEWFIGPNISASPGDFIGANWTADNDAVDFWLPFIRCECVIPQTNFYTVYNDRAVQVNQTCTSWDPSAVAATFTNMAGDNDFCGPQCIAVDAMVPDSMLPFVGVIPDVDLGARVVEAYCSNMEILTNYSRLEADASCAWLLVIDINYDETTDFEQTTTWCSDLNTFDLPQYSDCMEATQTCGPEAWRQHVLCPVRDGAKRLPDGDQIFETGCSAVCQCLSGTPFQLNQPCDAVQQLCTRREIEENCGEWCDFVGKPCVECTIVAPVISGGSLQPFFLPGSCVALPSTTWDNYTCTPPVPYTDCLFDGNNGTCDDEVTMHATCGPNSIACRNPCSNDECSTFKYQCTCRSSSNITTYYPDYETLDGPTSSAQNFSARLGCGVWPQVVKKICRYDDRCEPEEIDIFTYIAADTVAAPATFTSMKDAAANNAGSTWDDSDVKISCGRRAYSATIVDYRTSAAQGRTYGDWTEYLSPTGIGPNVPFPPDAVRTYPDSGVGHLTFLRCECMMGGKGSRTYSVWNDIPDQNGYNCDSWWQEVIDPFEVYPDHPLACPSFPTPNEGKQCNGLSDCHKYTFKGYDIDYRSAQLDDCYESGGQKFCSGTPNIVDDPVGSGDPSEMAWLAALENTIWNTQRTVCSMSGTFSWSNITCWVGPWVFRSTSFFITGNPACDKARLNTEGLGTCSFMFPLDTVNGPEICPSLGDMNLPRVRDECIPQLEDGTCRCGQAYQKSRIGWCDCTGWNQDVPFRSEMGPLPSNSIDARYPTAPYERCIMIVPNYITETDPQLTVQQVQDTIDLVGANPSVIYWCPFSIFGSTRVQWDTTEFGTCEPIEDFTVVMQTALGDFPDYFGGQFATKEDAYDAGSGGLGFGDLTTGIIIPVNCTNAIRTWLRNEMLTGGPASPPLPNETFANTWAGPAYNVFLPCGECPGQWSGDRCETLSTFVAKEYYTSGECNNTASPTVYTCIFVDPCPEGCEFDHDADTCVCDADWTAAFVGAEWISISTCWPSPPIPDPSLNNVDPCAPNGLCVSGTCDCDPAFGGQLCTVSSCPGTSAQHPDGCLGRGVCDGGVCDCGRWFYGDACEFSECSTGCEGICVVEENRYPKCMCTGGTYGFRCENELFTPFVSECIEGSPNYITGRCDCPEDSVGLQCRFDVDTDDRCGTESQGICSQNGFCNQQLNRLEPPVGPPSFGCVCDDDLFTGDKCDISICPLGPNSLPCSTGLGGVQRECLPDRTCMCEPEGGWVIDIEVAAEPFPDDIALLMSAPNHVMIDEACGTDVFIGCADYPVITGTGAGRQWTVTSLCGGMDMGYCDPTIPGDDKCVCTGGSVQLGFGNTTRCTTLDCEDPCYQGVCTPGVGDCVCVSPVWTGTFCNQSTCVDPFVPVNREGTWECGCSDPARDPSSDCAGFLCPFRDGVECGDIWFGADKFPFPYSEAATDILFGAPRGVKCDGTTGNCDCMLNVYEISGDDGTCVPLWNLDNTITITADDPFDIFSPLTTECELGWDPNRYCTERRCLNDGVWNMEGNEACPPTGPECCCTAAYTGDRCEIPLTPVTCTGNASAVENVCTCPNVLKGLPDCQESNCFGSATLIASGGGYACNCIGTYEGELCDVSMCLNGGLPSDTVCTCFNGWTGDICETPGTIAPTPPTSPAPTYMPTPMHQTAHPTMSPTAAPTPNNTGTAKTTFGDTRESLIYGFILVMLLQYAL